MPGPRIVNKEQEARRAALVERKPYFLTDPKCKEIMGVVVTDQVRENGLMLTQSEAMALVANGSITTDKAAATEAANTMVEQHDALMQRRADDEQAKLDDAQATTDAALHNAGEPVDKPADQGGLAPSGKPLSEAEATAALNKPADGTSPVPADPAAVNTAGTPPADASPSAEQKPTWAAQ